MTFPFVIVKRSHLMAKLSLLRKPGATLFTILGLLFWPAFSSAQSLFQHDGNSARTIGLGGPHLIAPTDPMAAIWSPALLASLREGQLLLSGDDNFEISAFGVTGFWPQIGGVGATFMRMIFPEEAADLNRVSLAWGKSWDSIISTGLAINANRFDENENFATATVGMLLHPWGDRLPLSQDLMSQNVFNAPLTPYTIALGFQAHDLPFGQERLSPYYSASLALRAATRGPSVLASYEWRDSESVTRLGFGLTPINRFALYAGVANFTSWKSNFGVAFLSESYSFDLAYAIEEKRFLGGLSLRLGRSPVVRSREHYDHGIESTKNRDYRGALHEFRRYRLYEPDNATTNELITRLEAKVAVEDQKIQELLQEAKTFELRHRHISAALNYLNVLKLDRNNRLAQQRLQLLEPKIDIYVNQLYTRGVQAFEEGNYETANKAFENILLVRKNHPEAEQYRMRLTDYRKQQANELFLRGLGYYSQKSFRRAETAFREALAVQPEHAEAQDYLNKTQAELEKQTAQIERWIAEAGRLERREQYLSAYKLYRQVLDLDAEHSGARQHLQALQTRIDGYLQGRVQTAERAFQRGDYARAEREFDAILVMSPSHRTALSYKQRLEEIKRTQVQELMRAAMSLYDARDWRRAVEAFERVLAVEPGNRLANLKRNEALSQIGIKELLEKGEEYYSRGQYLSAMQMFERVREKDPNNSRARQYLDNAQRQLNLKVEQHFNRGLNYYANEEYDSALREWDEALKLNPIHAQSLEYRGQARLKLEALERLVNP